MPGKPIKLVTLEDGHEVEIGQLDLKGDILFIDPFVWNINDLKECRPDHLNVVRKRRTAWGTETKGFYLLSTELKNQEA